MSSQIRFFASKTDLIEIMQLVECKSDLKYVQFGSSGTPTPLTFPTVSVIPDIGIASNPSAINCRTFLISQRNCTIRPRPVSEYYVFDQLLNPETVTFTPGGLWGGEILLHGRFATASSAGPSLKLMTVLRSVMRSNYTKIKAFYVGKEAEIMLDGGKRLTISAQSPRTIDLSRT